MSSIRIIQFLNQIINAVKVNKRGILFKHMSKEILLVAQILQDNNRIEDFEVIQAKTKKGSNINYISVKLLYWLNEKNEKQPFLLNVEFISKPSRVITIKVKDLHPIMKGNGFSILRTAKGVIDNRTAKKINTGGELLAICY